MLTQKIILDRIHANIDTVKSFGVKKIGLFGSYLRDEQKPESDVDILVEFEPGKKSFDNYMELKFYLEDLTGNKIDLVIAETVKPELKPYILGSVKYVQGL
mgnify:CR=1 FL=1